MHTSILLKNTHAGKLFSLLSTCSMQTLTYYVQTKSNLGRNMHVCNDYCL